MRKILLCSLMAIMCSNVAVGLDYGDFDGISTNSKGGRGDEWLHLGDTKYIECDDKVYGSGGAGNGTVVLVTRYDGVVRVGPYQCRTRDDKGHMLPDSWKRMGDLGWCDSNKCPDTGKSMYFGNDTDSLYKVCNKNGVKENLFKLSGREEILFLDYWKDEVNARQYTDDILCKYCISGYVPEGDKCVQKTTQCKWDDKPFNVGETISDDIECSKSSLEKAKTGKKCKLTCELRDGSAMRIWAIKSCPKGTKEVKNGNIITECKTNGGGNSGNTGNANAGSGDSSASVASCKNKRSSEEGKACCEFDETVTRFDEKTGHCICQKKSKSGNMRGGDDPDKEFRTNDNGKWGCLPRVAETCETKYKDDAQKLACCKLRNEGIADWFEPGNRCECKEIGKEYKYDEKEKTGSCVDATQKEPEKEPEKPKIPVFDCKYTVNLDIQCENGKRLNRGGTVDISNIQIQKEECETLTEKMKQLEKMVAKNDGRVNMYSDLTRVICRDGSGAVYLAIEQYRIDSAKDILKDFFKDAESNASVWKTADGSFNTARLASDLTAGVVLGTVGGVVSGHVIKKNQIKKGFEVLHCTVAGQTIADWGDEFSVGMQ